MLRSAAGLAFACVLAPWPVLAQNLIQNGGFASSLGGWQQQGSVTATWDSSDAAGTPTSGSAKLAAPASNSQGGLQQSFSVTPGYSYEFSASSRGVPFAGSVTFGFQHPYRVTYNVINNLWRSDSVVLHAVPSASTGSIELSMNNASAGASAFFDQVSVVQLPTAIRSFTASSPSIAQGQCASLMIAASSATSLSIDQGVGALQESFNAQWLVPNRCPTTTTTYTLTVSGPTGTVTAKPRSRSFRRRRQPSLRYQRASARAKRPLSRGRRRTQPASQSITEGAPYPRAARHQSRHRPRRPIRSPRAASEERQPSR
jgi:hypothetical protein